jgi:hypothetical protein
VQLSHGNTELIIRNKLEVIWIQLPQIVMKADKEASKNFTVERAGDPIVAQTRHIPEAPPLNHSILVYFSRDLVS